MKMVLSIYDLSYGDILSLQKAVSPTVSGNDKSGESYRKWNL